MNVAERKSYKKSTPAGVDFSYVFRSAASIEMPNFIAQICGEKVGRHGESAKISYEKSTPRVHFIKVGRTAQIIQITLLK